MQTPNPNINPSLVLVAHDFPELWTESKKSELFLTENWDWADQWYCLNKTMLLSFNQ